MAALQFFVGIFSFLAFTADLAQGQQLTTQVEVPELGTIEGYVALTSREGAAYWTFIGIPYADPASYTGERRFQASSVWAGPLSDDVFKADDLLCICAQSARLDLPIPEMQNLEAVYRSASKSKKHIRKAIRESNGIQEAKSKFSPHWGREACLTLNINTKNIPDDPDTDELYPVIVFFHGGGSDSFWGSVFTGQRLLDEKVVLITLNYRLGTLGALNFGLDESPGNQAMYDAIVALEWIQRHVKYFGGDPNKVTITGQSAGAMMVTHLLLSPLADGLFHGVWGFSGSALNVWGTAVHPSLPHHLEVAFYAGCYDKQGPAPDEAALREILTCMKGADLQTLVDAMELYIFEEESHGGLGYDARVPSIQSDKLTIPKFLTEDPMNILHRWEQSPVPLVLGATRHDGSYPVEDIYNNFLVPNNLHKNESFIRNDMIPLLMNIMGIHDDTGALYHSFAQNYFGDAAYSDKFNEKVPGMIDMSTVLGFKGGQYKMVEYQAKVAPEQSWFYSFDYFGRWTLYHILNDFTMYIPGGISHTDDLIYYFFFFPVWNDDMLVSRRVVRYFVNFATYGNPNGPPDAKLLRGQVNWEPFNDMKHPYLSIDRKDEVFPDCPDSWIGVAEELGIPPDDDEEPEPTTSPPCEETTATEPCTTEPATNETPPTGTTTTEITTTTSTTTTTEDTTPDSSSRAQLTFLPIFTLILCLVRQ